MVSDQLIKKIRKRDNAAFKKAYEQSIRYVYSIVGRYVKNDSDHADIIQEVYARVFLSIKSYDSKKGKFKYWLRRIAINQCFEHYRKGKPEISIVSLEGVRPIDNSLEQRLSQLSVNEIEQYISGMPEGYKQVFMLIVLEDFTHKEVGELMGISPEASRSQLSRAKNWLRKNVFNRNDQGRYAVGL